MLFMNRSSMSLKLIVIFILLLSITGFAQEKITLVGVGDCIFAKKLSQLEDPAFINLINLIKKADIAWANAETVIADVSDKYPAYRTMDLHAYCAPWAAKEFSLLGFDIVGIANNHAMDFSAEGLFETIYHLKENNLVFTGAGKNLEEASKPVYYDSKHGRIGFVNCASTFQEGAHASETSNLLIGRPGINPLRFDFIQHVKKDTFNAIKKLKEDLEIFYGVPLTSLKEPDSNHISMYGFDGMFKKDKEIGFTTIAHKKDLSRIINSIKVAKNNAHIVIAAIHEHESDPKTFAPASHLVDFARAAIDAGADVVFNTGPHQPLGIEIYKGKPIFYSLGNFIFHFYNNRSFPKEIFEEYNIKSGLDDSLMITNNLNEVFFKNIHYWWSFVPVITFDKKTGKVSEIVITPIDLSKGKNLIEKGTPALADSETAEKIIKHLQTISKQFKTKIIKKDKQWVIKL